MPNIFSNRFRYLRQHGVKAYVIALSNKLGKRAIKLGKRTRKLADLPKQASKLAWLLIDKTLRAFLGQRYLDFRSRRYWNTAEDSYRGSEDYYNRQEIALNEMLSSITGLRRAALDVGCSDGRFTLMIAKSYDKVLGLDLSKEFVKRARENAERLEVANVFFEQVDLTRSFPKGEYDLVACMGVTQAIVGEDAFHDCVINLADSTRQGGMLVTKDSLSRGQYWEKMNGSYVAACRPEEDYLNKFSGLGFKLVKKVELARSKNLVNYICLWEKRQPE